MSRGTIVDIGGTNIRFGITGISPQTPLITVHTPPTCNEIVDVIISGIMSLRAYCPDAVNRVAVSCPGLIKNGFIKKAIYIDIMGIDLKEEILKRCNSRNVIIENDANFQAFGRYNGKNLLYLAIGTAIGGAYIDKNGIFKGTNGFACEFGHVYVGGTEKCYCGKFGCLDAYASGKKMTENLGEGWWNKQFEPIVEKNCKFVGQKVAQAIDTLCILFDPEEIYICGNICMNTAFVNSVRSHLLKSTWWNHEVNFDTSTWKYVYLSALKLFSQS